MRLNLQLSCYNGARYLPFLFDSLKKQTLKEWHLYILDNASDEENKTLIEQAVTNFGLPVSLFRVETNIGFAGAHNFLFEKTKDISEAIQLLNDDAILDKFFLEHCLNHLEKQSRLGSVSGRIFRWDFEHRDDPSGGRTQIVDSFGLKTNLFGLVQDIGSGTSAADVRVPKGTFPVFGVSGCLPMYRVSAIQRVTVDGNLFDGRFVIYKEDVELAFRLQAGGYGSATVDGAQAWHRRSYGLKPTDLKRPANDNAYQSYRNHLWLWIVHLRGLSLITNRIGLIPCEIAKAVYWLLRKPSFLFKAISQTTTEWPTLMEKRQKISQIRQCGPRDERRPSPPSVDLAVVVVSHDELNEAVLVSLAEARKRFQGTVAIIVVDNHSKTYEANAFVEKYIPDAWVLLRNGDFGYGRSMNKGAALVNATDYFILNPDTSFPDPDLFTKLRDYARSHPDVGLIAPKIQSFNGDLQETCRRFPTWFQPLIQRSSLKNTAFGKRYLEHFLMKDVDHDVEQPVDWAQGSAMYLPGNVWNTLGGFDDRFWLYFEDIDLCRRVWQMGKRVVYLPSVTIKHAHGRQSARIQNLILNIIKTKETRGHLKSWMQYMWKWRFESLPDVK